MVADHGWLRINIFVQRLAVSHRKSKTKGPQQAGLVSSVRAGLTLARLVTGVFLVNDVNAPLAPHDTAVTVAGFKAFQRVNDFHGPSPYAQIL
jgi:hypothetical protein